MNRKEIIKAFVPYAEKMEQVCENICLDQVSQGGYEYTNIIKPYITFNLYQNRSFMTLCINITKCPASDHIKYDDNHIGHYKEELL